MIVFVFICDKVQVHGNHIHDIPQCFVFFLMSGYGEGKLELEGAGMATSFAHSCLLPLFLWLIILLSVSW